MTQQRKYSQQVILENSDEQKEMDKVVSEFSQKNVGCEGIVEDHFISQLKTILIEKHPLREKVIEIVTNQLSLRETNIASKMKQKFDEEMEIMNKKMNSLEVSLKSKYEADFKEKQIFVEKMHKKQITDWKQKENKSRKQVESTLKGKIAQLQSLLNEAIRQKQMYKNKAEAMPNPFVSNSIHRHTNIFQFIKREIESFTSEKLKKAKLIYQSDTTNQNISNYLRMCQDKPSTFVILFFTNNNTIFGIYSESIFLEKSDQKDFKAFAFNATKEMTFIANSDSKDPLAPLSYMDSCLVLGNRELILKNNSVKSIKVHCGNIIGSECFRIKRKQHLTGQNKEQIQLKRVEIHKLTLN